MLTIATINALLLKRELDWKKRLAMLLLSKIMLNFAEDMEKGMTPVR